jgi:hypothetical protein
LVLGSFNCLRRGVYATLVTSPGALGGVVATAGGVAGAVDGVDVSVDDVRTVPRGTPLFARGCLACCHAASRSAWPANCFTTSELRMRSTLRPRMS